MSLRIPILGLICLAAISVCAEEQGGAPLEGTKQELKKLQTDQATRNSAAATGKLAEGMPQIQTSIPGALQLETPSAEKAKEARGGKTDAPKNWLLDGVDKLGKSTSSKNRSRHQPASAAELPDDGAKLPDSSDPDYILQVYIDQKMTDEAKADQRKSTASRGDPFAPFLQDWLETSPARGKFFDDFVRKPDAAGGAPATGPGPAERSFSHSAGRVEIAGSTRSVPAKAQPNPYLQGLDTLTLQDPGTAHKQSAAMTNAPASPAPRQPSGSLVDPITAGRPAVKKPPLLAPSDDKKYFPQLKKF